MTGFSAPAADQGLDRLLGEEGFADDLFSARRYQCVALVEAVGLDLAIGIAGQLGLAELLAAPATVGELLAQGGWVPAFRPGLGWVLERLAAAGLIAVSESAGERRYRLASRLPPPRLEWLREEAMRLDPAVAPTLDLLTAAAEAYPRVARGEINGTMFLFSRVGLWQAFLDEANWYYSLTNRVAAHAAAERLPASGIRALEVGAGLGSGTEALLAALAARGTPAALESFRVTEPAALFRRHLAPALAERHPDLQLDCDGFDINLRWQEQGCPSAGLDLIWGTNVFHLARDLDAALSEALAALRPGGWLILGEGMRPYPGQCITIELIFQLLSSFVAVETHPGHRASYGFLTPDEWLRALERAGFTTVRLVPDLLRVREVCPLLCFGAVCGRRPPEGGEGP